ncbi:MAG: hypothetical protein IT435_14365 [Phycisphaerales bacterium]|nr:hypothetical protein [Phycisphaerales bacterium]
MKMMPLQAMFAAAVLWQPAAAGICQPASEPAKPSQPAQDEKKEPPADDGGLGSLDESLGLEKKPKKLTDGEPAVESSDLDKQLRDENPGDDLTQAAALMDRVAGRLEKSKDTSLATQRMQEEAMRRLDKLISDAKKQRQQQQQKKRPQNQQQQQNQEQQQSEQQKQASESSQQNQDNQGQVIDPAARRDGALRNVSPGGTAAWGNLPEHVRSSLMQGFSDQFSAMYQAMTEAYYRRLAEDRAKADRPAGGNP